jgi:hypothetical protein
LPLTKADTLATESQFLKENNREKLHNLLGSSGVFGRVYDDARPIFTGVR